MHCANATSPGAVRRLTGSGVVASVFVFAAFVLAVFVLVLLTGTGLWAQEKTPEISPSELVRVTVANEIAAANHSEIHHLFRSRRQTSKGSQTRIYAETNDAIAGMLVASNDRPLNPVQQKAETDRLASLINNPDQLRRKEAREKEDEDRSLRIVKALPYAFLYEYAGTESSEPGLGKPGNTLVKLSFKPNPNYNPPTHVEQVLTGVKGYLLIDTQVRRLARIDGILFQDVTFGWGILGHLNQGGHFRVQQADLGLSEGDWGITEMNLNMTGKILMFKSISIVSDEVLTDFHRLPNKLTFAQGVKILETDGIKLAHINHIAETTEAKREGPN